MHTALIAILMLFFSIAACLARRGYICTRTGHL